MCSLAEGTMKEQIFTDINYVPNKQNKHLLGLAAQPKLHPVQANG